ncbi:hypothetical protein [Bacteroides ovatus]
MGINTGRLGFLADIVWKNGAYFS